MISRTQVLALPLTLLIAFAASTAVLALPMSVHAQLPSGGSQNSPLPSGGEATQDSGGGVLVNPLSVDSLPELINKIIQGVVQLAGIALTIALVVIGFRFVAAQGKPEELKKTRTALMWTLIGGLILLGASGISQLVATTVQSL